MDKIQGERDMSFTPNLQAGSNGNGSGPRRTISKVTPDKKMSEDEFMAAALGDTEWLRQSLRGSKGVINFDKNGLAAIHLAAIHGRLDSLKLLIEKMRMDVNLPSSTGWRPLHLVISNQTGKRALTCLHYLLDKGAHPSICNDDGISPVHQAASEGHVQCLKALIDVNAVIDGEDHRGHKPIDLAKLWGHKKCARILATEMWHRDKDHIAKEIKKLEKQKMQSVLQDIEREEEQLAHQKFFGELAFNQWLESKAVPSKQNLAKPGKSNKASEKSVQPTKPKVSFGLAKPNSKRQEPSYQVKVAGVPRSRAMDTFPQNTTTPTIAESPESVDSESEHEAPVKPQVCMNPKWNKSTKLPRKEYTSNLPDYYPRDEYTMLPKYPLKRGGVPQSTEVLRASKLSSSPGSSRPDLPDTVINKALDHSLDRPVLYKPVAIMDVHKRKHYTEEEVGVRTEAGMHLTNDINSRLFRRGLLEPMRLAKSAQSTPSSVSMHSEGSSSQLSQPSVIQVDVTGMMELMKRMSRPQTYPAIRGEEYVLATRQIPGT